VLQLFAEKKLFLCISTTRLNSAFLFRVFWSGMNYSQGTKRERLRMRAVRLLAAIDRCIEAAKDVERARDILSRESGRIANLNVVHPEETEDGN